MKLPARVTIALPVGIILIGALIPLVARSGGDAPPPPEAPEVRTMNGKTAGEWCSLAAAAAERGQYDRAIGFMKTAEEIDPGQQYAADLVAIRRARWRALEISRERERILGGEVARLDFADDGTIAIGGRNVIVLPGESLWSLARSAAAAERGLLPEELADLDPSAVRWWDRLTEQNGVRELEVGELVLVPLREDEVAHIETGNREDLERIAAAVRAFAVDRIEVAEELRAEVVGEFAPATTAGRALDAELGRARDAREARRYADDASEASAAFNFARAESLAIAAVRLGADPSVLITVGEESALREAELVESAHDLVLAAEDLPRLSRYAELVRTLDDARARLTEAEGLSPGVQYAQASGVIDGMRSEVDGVRVRGDGSLDVLKPAGTAYIEAARGAVEWLLARRLIASGVEFPYYDRKSLDEIAWAGFLQGAATLAEENGIDFTLLLRSTDEMLRIELPNPALYFEQEPEVSAHASAE